MEMTMTKATTKKSNSLIHSALRDMRGALGSAYCLIFPYICFFFFLPPCYESRHWGANGGAWFTVFWARLWLAGFNIATRTGAGGGFYLVFVSWLFLPIMFFPTLFLSASGRVYSYPPRSIARTYIHFSFRRIEVRFELLSAEIVCLA